MAEIYWRYLTVQYHDALYMRHEFSAIYDGTRRNEAAHENEIKTSQPSWVTQ